MKWEPVMGLNRRTLWSGYIFHKSGDHLEDVIMVWAWLYLWIHLFDYHQEERRWYFQHFHCTSLPIDSHKGHHYCEWWLCFASVAINGNYVEYTLLCLKSSACSICPCHCIFQWFVFLLLFSILLCEYATIYLLYCWWGCCEHTSACHLVNVD